MKKIYDKNELNFAFIWIGIYVVLASIGDNVSNLIGISKIVTAPICVILTGVLWYWIHKNELTENYGLCKFQGELKKYLYFIPLVLLASTNIWYGVRLNLSWLETILYMISMLCVGFLEEIIFRGFLFKALCRSNIKRAIFISGITFGFGHIVNLLNGRDVAETLMQICYAVAIGLLFTIIFYKGKSLWPCIITHSAMNSLSVFANEDARTLYNAIGTSVFLCVVSIGYMIYILKKTDQKQ